MIKNSTIDNIRLDGGALCLDFVNTIPDRYDGSGRDHLTNFSDLIYWGRKAGILQTSLMTALEKANHSHEKKAKTVFAEAVRLRDLIYAIFRPVTLQQKVTIPDLDSLNQFMASYSRYLEISNSKEGFSERWNFGKELLLSVNGPIIKSAYDLLLSGKLNRVKECPSCGWLFLDSTKNGKRKWCSMEDCGSNAKALDYYYRKKKENE